MTPTSRKNEVRSLSLKNIAELVEGELLGDPHVTITGVAGIKEAKKGDITFVSNVKYLPFLHETEASAVIVSKDVPPNGKALVRTANPSVAFTKIIEHFKPSRAVTPVGVHPTAVVGVGATLGAGAALGPHVVLGEGVTIGARTVLEAGTYIGAGSTIGSDVRIYPNVTVREETEIGDRVIVHSGAVIGSDGFGYETLGGAHAKIPHLGNVVIEDDVEIGANVCIDRGRFQSTRVKKGVKVDNLVQIAHNVVVGENTLLVSQCGISGSTELGKNVIVAGQAGIVGHLSLGDGVIVAAGAGVTKSVEAGMVVLGAPARPISEQKRLFALISRLPELFKEVAEMRKKLGS